MDRKYNAMQGIAAGTVIGLIIWVAIIVLVMSL